MSIFETSHTHNLLVYEDGEELHKRKDREDDQCRPTHESDHDAKLYMAGNLTEEGYDICPGCLPDRHERYSENHD